jgi:hypothetical protein
VRTGSCATRPSDRAHADARVVLLDTIPGIGDLLGLTLASEIGDIARFSSPRKLTGYASLAPKLSQSGDRSRTGALSKAGSRTLRWATVEAAQHAWRPSNPWHQLYSDLAQRAGKNPAKQQPFKPAAPRRPILPRQARAAFWPPDGPCMELRSRDSSHEHSAQTQAPKEK